MKNIPAFSKIRHLEEISARQTIGMIFTKAANLSGIKEPISEINKTDLRDLIFSKYDFLTLEEIEYAFKHDRFSGDPIPHFQLFNAEYVAKVLKRYTDFRRQMRTEHASKLKEPTPDPIITDEMRAQIREKFLKFLFEELKKEGFSDSAWLVYDDIKEKANVSREVLIRLFKIQSLKFQKTKRIRKLQGYKATSGSVENACRNIVACNYLKNYLTNYETFKNAIQ